MGIGYIFVVHEGFLSGLNMKNARVHCDKDGNNWFCAKGYSQVEIESILEKQGLLDLYKDNKVIVHLS